VNRYLLLGLLAAATPVAARAEAPVAPPATGWSVNPGLSETHSAVCSLVGDLGQHRALALVADAARSRLGFLLLFDDGAARPRPQAAASRLTIAASGSRPLSIPGTMRFGQFRTTLDHKSSRHFLHLFDAKTTMTVALNGEPPVAVDLTGTANAAQVMKRCEEAQNIAQPTATHRRVADASARSRHLAAGPRRVRLVTSLHKPAVIALDDPPPPAVAPPPPPAIAAAPLPPVIAAAPLPPVIAAAPPPPAIAAAPPPPLVPAASPPPVTALADPVPPVAMTTPLPVPMLPAPASLPAPSAVNPVTLLIGKAMEVQFVVIVQDATASYKNTGNEIESRSARATRAEELCTLLGHGLEADSWPGTIAALPDAEGSGALSVALADGITVQTMGAGSSEAGHESMIDQGSALSNTLSQMQVGEPITFSGQFFASDADCVIELSRTQEQSMTTPSFLMKFTAVTAQQ
jgi:hypothetical protein